MNTTHTTDEDYSGAVIVFIMAGIAGAIIGAVAGFEKWGLPGSIIGGIVTGNALVFAAALGMAAIRGETK